MAPGFIAPVETRHAPTTITAASPVFNIRLIKMCIRDRDVTDLSGGQRTKVLLGKLLLEKPDILLLDEPTNYLDVQHIEWLRRYLQEYENAFILISHDIPFLNSVINLIYHMENQRLDRYVGDYDKFQEVYAVKKSQLEAAYKLSLIHICLALSCGH